jgi:riboflavin biosynthesis pyrimidine reductase
MRQLFPTALDDVDPLDLYPGDHRPRSPDRPWVLSNMVASVDGAVAIDGVSGGLGGEPDRLVFRAIRASCDWIIVAAGTARAETYGIPRSTDEVARRRAAVGRGRAPRLAVVTGSVDLDPGLPMFADRRPEEDPVVVMTGATPPPDRVAALRGLAEVVSLDAERPTPRLALDELDRRGADVVLAEGGPSFNGQLVAEGLVDELCLTTSPHLVGGTSSRIVAGSTGDRPAALDLVRLLESGGVMFARYLVVRRSVE